METRRAHVEVKPRPAAFAVRPLSPALGAEIVGVDLGQEIDGRTFAQIRDAWHEHLVILLRDQELSEEDQVRRMCITLEKRRSSVSTGIWKS